MKLTSKIGVMELACLLFISNISRLFLTFPQTLVDEGETAAWLVAIISLLASLLMFWFIVNLMKKFPGKTLMEATEETLGPYLGTLVNLAYAAYFFILVFILFREYGEAMITSALPETPISVVMGVFALASLGTMFYSLETLARTARLVTPFIVVGFFLLFVTVLPEVTIQNYAPILGSGPIEVLWTGLKYSMISEALLAAVFFPIFQGWENFRKAGFYAILAGCTALVIFVLIFVGVFISNMAKEQTLPFYAMARIINLGRFFQRIEAIFLMAWGMVGMIKVAVSLYAAAVIMAKALKLPDYRPILLVGLVLTYTLAFLPPDLPTAILWQQQIRYWGFVPTLGLPALVYFITFFRKRKQGALP